MYTDAATTWMFPWERRQLSGGELSTWEKWYWGVFVLAIAVFLLNRAGGIGNSSSGPTQDESERAEKLELEKQQKARLVLAGGSMLDEEDDPFEGLSPEVRGIDLSIYIHEWNDVHHVLNVFKYAGNSTVCGGDHRC